MTDNSASDPAFDRRWHLAQSEPEVAITELEFALIRAGEGFDRWQSECLAGVADLVASGPENALLHVIRMRDRPKTAKELAQLMNRDDLPNIQYSLRKLVGAGLVERKGSGRAGVTYEATEKGCGATDAYAQLRRRLLLAALDDLPDLPGRLEEATKVLNLLSGIYEEVARVAATHRRR